MTGIIDNQTVEGLLDHKGLRFNGSTQATANSTLVLTSASEYLVIFTGTVVGQILQLPDATTVSFGRTFQVWNTSTALVTVNNASAGFQATLNPGQRTALICVNTSTAAGNWIREITSGSAFAGTTPVQCSYTASAGSGRYLEFYPSNSSDLGPFLIISTSTIVGIAIVANASATGTVSVYKTTDLATVIASISLAAQSSNSVVGLNVPLAIGDKLAAKVSSGSIQKPGVSIYVAGA